MFETLENIVRIGAMNVARLAELCAMLIIAAAIAEALWRAAAIFIKRDTAPDAVKEELRLQLGRWLAASLEFLLAADILLTAIAPTWDDIGKLGAIAFLRTALNYFLQKEIEAHARQYGNSPKANTPINS